MRPGVRLEVAPLQLVQSCGGRGPTVFVEGPDSVIVVDFLHSRSGLPRRLAALADHGPRQGH